MNQKNLEITREKAALKRMFPHDKKISLAMRLKCAVVRMNKHPKKFTKRTRRAVYDGNIALVYRKSLGK